MRIFFTGATGFIGNHLLRRLIAAGHQARCLTRAGSATKLSSLSQVEIVIGDLLSPDQWLDRLIDCDLLINCIGIIKETGSSTFARVHAEVPMRMFETAARHGIKGIIQISGMGADDQADSRYHLTKRRADRYLAELGTPYLVLRPSFVYGPGDFSMAMFTRMARLPITPVPGDGEFLVQPLHIGDLTRAVQIAIDRRRLPDRAIDLGGGEILSFNALLDILAEQYGEKARAVKLHIPWPIMQLTANLTDALGGFGPITGDQLLMLKRGNFADNQPFIELFGFKPIPFREGIKYRDRAEIR